MKKFIITSVFLFFATVCNAQCPNGRCVVTPTQTQVVQVFKFELVAPKQVCNCQTCVCQNCNCNNVVQKPVVFQQPKRRCCLFFWSCR